MSEDSLARLDRNPMRILDSKDKADRRIVADAADHRPVSDRHCPAFYEKLQDHLIRFRVPLSKTRASSAASTTTATPPSNSSPPSSVPKAP